ncbi:MAG: hypothetical protein JXA64_03405 [Candidatus Fermentibacteraceae bacterium]|nr:hypothetical protein [Candidatus Fermentibacteraceae bacterium]MBN2608139.1 hypothetical protein [Candidatus Fermentibacteraceae bacterium]
MSNENARARIYWLQLEVDAMENPPSLNDNDLMRFEGVYGPRRVKLRDGILYYSREGLDQPERMLMPLTSAVFVLGGSTDWRFRFEFDRDGDVIAIEGISVFGPVDRHERME